MKIGVVFPQTEIGSDPAVIRDFAQAVEEMGFEHLLVYDHVLGARIAGSNPERWRELGATHISIVTMGAGLATPDDHLKAAGEYREAIGS